MQDSNAGDDRPPFITDDDAQVIDSLVTSTDAPPDTETLPRARVDDLRRDVKRHDTTRLYTRTTTLAPNAPYLMAGEDAVRRSLVLSCVRTDGSTVIRIAGESSDCLNPITSAAYAVKAGDTVSLDHTGTVYVSASESVTISTTIITEGFNNGPRG